MNHATVITTFLAYLWPAQSKKTDKDVQWGTKTKQDTHTEFQIQSINIIIGSIWMPFSYRKICCCPLYVMSRTCLCSIWLVLTKWSIQLHVKVWFSQYLEPRKQPFVLKLGFRIIEQKYKAGVTWNCKIIPLNTI